MYMCGGVLFTSFQGLPQGELCPVTVATGSLPGKHPTPPHLAVYGMDQMPKDAQKVGLAGRYPEMI